MHNDYLEPSYPVITDWDEFSECPFAAKRWVNRSNVDEEKSYEVGDFLRVYCEHDGCWCNAEFGVDNCVICSDHLAE